MRERQTERPGPQVYSEVLNGEAYRVLGMLDRDANSPSFGSIDRINWAWKFTDFPGARFQEGLCYLSFLYATEFDGNSLYGRKQLLEWLQGGIMNWTAIQGRGGDFDEAYPCERSLAATAFTSFYLAEAYLLLRPKIDEETSQAFQRSLHKAASWLTVHDEHHGFLSNHLAAAAAALLHAYQILGDDRFLRRYRHFLGKILDHQSREGWYEEYGGADPGYQTHGTFYLARCFELTGDEDLLRSLNQSCNFLKHFIHADLSLGGEYASRNTQTYYPAAYEMLATHNGSASWIASEMRPSVQNGNAVGLKSIDTYNYFPLLNNYVFAYRACLDRSEDLCDPDPPPTTAYTKHFVEAGLLKVRNDSYDLFVGVSKGCVIKMFDRKRKLLKFSSSGYVGRMKNGKSCSTQIFDPQAVAMLTESGIEQVVPFGAFSRPRMTPLRFLLFRMFSLSVGRIGFVSTWLKRLLVKVLIYRKSALPFKMARRILTTDHAIEVVDRIYGTHQSKLEKLQHQSIFTTIHMGSSRYFTPNELDVPTVIDDVNLIESPSRESLEIRIKISVDRVGE